jgi:hypothetical protein
MSKKEYISLNSGVVGSNLPNYSGWLGGAWFEKALKYGFDSQEAKQETEGRQKYIEQIKKEKLEKIKANNLVLFAVKNDHKEIFFGKEDDSKFYFYGMRFDNKEELDEIIKRTGSEEQFKKIQEQGGLYD